MRTIRRTNCGGACRTRAGPDMRGNSSDELWRRSSDLRRFGFAGSHRASGYARKPFADLHIYRYLLFFKI